MLLPFNNDEEKIISRHLIIGLLMRSNRHWTARNPIVFGFREIQVGGTANSSELSTCPYAKRESWSGITTLCS